MKIGILTFHNALNVGAQLQCFALSCILGQYGIVEVVNYSPPFISKPYTFFRAAKLQYGFLSIIKQIVIQLFHFYEFPFYLKRTRHYRLFQKRHLPISSSSITKTDDLMNQNYDFVFVGSDQVWNTEFTNGVLDQFYTLNGNFSFKKISYAASFNENTITESEKKELGKRLRSFYAISLRESYTKDVLQPYVNRDIDLVIDPTLLLKKEIWERYINKKPLVEGDYILCHQARGNEVSFNAYTQMFANILGTKCINTTGVQYRRGSNNMQYVGPLEFMNLVSHAKCVVSASFHATATAIIMHKPFFSIQIGDGRDGRERDLLQRLNLLNQIKIIKDLNKLSIPFIDYVMVDELLEKERNHSLSFINNILLKR